MWNRWKALTHECMIMFDCVIYFCVRNTYSDASSRQLLHILSMFSVALTPDSQAPAPLRPDWWAVKGTVGNFCLPSGFWGGLRTGASVTHTCNFALVHFHLCFCCHPATRCSVSLRLRVSWRLHRLRLLTLLMHLGVSVLTVGRLESGFTWIWKERHV